MTWRPEDCARQATGRGPRRAPRAAIAPDDAPLVRQDTDMAMPTHQADILMDMEEEIDATVRLPLDAEREYLGMGFIPERHWNMVRQWMFRGTTAL